MADFDWSFGDDLSLQDLFKPGAPCCHRCGAPAPEGVPDSDARCERCGVHLHTCANCMFFSGLGCMILEPSFWSDSAVRGKFCPSFIWRDESVPLEFPDG